jgi:HAD superfamily hydrolase (TIGR01450 family)
MSELPERVRLVIFDLDGVVYRGHEAIAGAAEIVTSTSATIEHLQRHAPQVRSVLAIGADGMRAELTDAGLDVTMAGDASGRHEGGPLERTYDAVIVGLDPHVDYHRLSYAMRAVEDGARFVATNADARYPTPVGFLPGAGAIVAAVATASGVEPEIIGKPAPAMFRAIVEAAGVSPSEAVVIGDNPDSDVLGAHRAGCSAILVLTGVADGQMAAALTSGRRPEAVAADPHEVRALLEGRVSR